MPYNGSGTFDRPVSAYVFDTVISETDMNTEMSGIATGLSTAIAKDGQTTITANLPMAGFRHTGVGNAGARDDYAAAGQVQDGALRNGGVAGGTADVLTLTLTPALAAYAARQKFRFTSGAAPNTGAATVNVNALGAKAIEKAGAALAAGDLEASTVYEIIYDGTAFQLGEQIISASVTTLADAAITAAIATQAEQEAATSTTDLVTPGRQHFHPGMAKAWGKIGVTGNLIAGYGIASISDDGVGQITVTWDTAFSSADYCVQVSITDSDHTSTNRGQVIITQLAGSVTIINERSDNGNQEDPNNWFVVAYGDFA